MMTNIGFLLFKMVCTVVIALIIVRLIFKFKGKDFAWKPCLLGAVIGTWLIQIISFIFNLLI